MGLQGYLSQLTADQIYSFTDKVFYVTELCASMHVCMHSQYMCMRHLALILLMLMQSQHELTAIGLLLGLAAEKYVSVCTYTTTNILMHPLFSL